MTTFYNHNAVRQRLIEFLGGDTIEHATAVYLARSDGCQFDRKSLLLPSEIHWFLGRDLDIARSLADSASMLFHLDVEYVNFDSPACAYLDPWRAFAHQEPIVHVIQRLLLEWGIRPLHIITGQGHHFVWRIERGSDLCRRIEDLNPAPELLDELQERIPTMLRGRIDRDAQRAFGGISLIMEYVAHRVKKEAAPHSSIPVEITAVAVGPGVKGQREIVSVDISEYGDPLHSRVIRVPFTYYLKPVMTRLINDPELVNKITKVRAIPLHEMDVRMALKVRRVEGEVQDLAERACVRIPEQSSGTARLLDEYLASRLRRFHEFYYSDIHDERHRWPETYGRVPRDCFPPCIQHLVEQPNDALLKPAGMQLVTRCLLAQDWHPRHVAGFIRSKFEDVSYGWGVGWDDYDAATRADFYTRIFAGLYETGLDGLVDFNCTSTLEKGFCHSPAHAGPCLEPLRQTLLSRQCV